MMSKLCYLLAHEALTRFRARTLSPVELMEAVIRQAEAVKDSVNVLTHTHFDDALDLARKAEGKYARGARARPLKGLPIGIKDESRIAGTHFVGIADPEGCRGQNDLDQQRANSWCRRHRPCPVLGLFEVDPDLHKNTEATLQVVRSLGASVTEVETGWSPKVLEACMACRAVARTGCRRASGSSGAAIRTVMSFRPGWPMKRKLAAGSDRPNPAHIFDSDRRARCPNSRLTCAAAS
ncbi:MAG: hypothetical protein JNK34_07660 [Tabrizicola sp.]|nr:hypothetical protein [Tabrizicola sp.]